MTKNNIYGEGLRNNGKPFDGSSAHRQGPSADQHPITPISPYSNRLMTDEIIAENRRTVKVDYKDEPETSLKVRATVGAVGLAGGLAITSILFGLKPTDPGIYKLGPDQVEQQAEQVVSQQEQEQVRQAELDNGRIILNQPGN